MAQSAPTEGWDRKADLRFWQKVVVEGDCWIWNASRTAATGTNGGGGYGTFGYRGKVVKAHRWAYQQMVGQIPDGLELDHLCRNRACVNPSHLDPVTKSVNLCRGAMNNRLKTHCPSGHEYTEENTYRDSKGRQCRTCRRVHWRTYELKRRMNRG